MVVLVVTMAPGVRSTSVFSMVEVLEKEKTFFGARSRGLRIVLVPDPTSSSTSSLLLLMLSEDDDLSSSSVVDDEEVEDSMMLALFLLALTSIFTSAALTSDGSDVQASNMDADKVGACNDDASSL